MAGKGKVFTGARAKFSINGIKVGYASGVTFRETIEYEDVRGLDSIEVLEQVPVGYSVTLSARRTRLVGESFKAMGLFPATGVSSDEHLRNILLAAEFTATVEDSHTQKLIATISQVKFESVGWSVDSRGVVGEDVTFRAIRAKDESEVT